jgi:hypothetical protein
MSPALSAVLAAGAMLLAILALVLATIANRRWAARPVRGAGPGVQDLLVLDAALTSLRAQVDGLSQQVDALEPIPEDPEDPIEVVAGRVEGLDARLEGLETAVSGVAGRLAETDIRVQELADDAARAAGDPTALRHIAVVRYDAFADVGGRLSYSVALLDDTHSGLVLTTLAGKADVRTYVRTVSAGSPDGSLTAEEQQAIDAAVGSGQ